MDIWLAWQDGEGLAYSPSVRAALAHEAFLNIHPFYDGNGRVARIMMNAELSSKGLAKIMIPTVYREDYMGALKKFTKQGNCDIYIRTMQRAHEFSANLYDEGMDSMQDYLNQCNAFDDDSDVVLKIVPRL